MRAGLSMVLLLAVQVSRSQAQFNECDIAPCGSGQTCTDPNFFYFHDYVCTCSNGVSLVDSAVQCEKDECDDEPCNAGEVCFDPNIRGDAHDDYTCTAPPPLGLSAVGCLSSGKFFPLEERSSAAVRCCSMDGTECTTPSDPCMPKVSLQTAADACAAEGKRLCSSSELYSGVCCETGCEFDQFVVWVNDYVPPPPAVTEAPKDPTVATFSVDGCVKTGEEELIPLLSTRTEASVSCCSFEGQFSRDYCFPAVSNTCTHPVSYVTAEALCASYGLRLCSIAQVEAKLCCSGGCSENNVVWVRDEPSQ